MVGGTLNRKIQSQLNAKLCRCCTQLTKLLNAAQLFQHRVVSAILRPDGVGTAGIARHRDEGIIAPLAIATPDGVDGWKVENIKAHGLNGWQTRDNILKGSVHSRVRG